MFDSSFWGNQPAPFPLGAKSLFIGNSQFIWPANNGFDAVAALNLEHFPEHNYTRIFEGNTFGSARIMWANREKREKIEEILKPGDVDLLGFGYVTPLDSRPEDYQNFIDLALSYNNNTSFFIGSPPMFYGSLLPHTVWNFFTDLLASTTLEVVESLRQSNPDTNIYHIPFGQVAKVVYDEYLADNLEDINSEYGWGNPNALFADTLGHGGPMMTKLQGLIMLEFLYGRDINSQDMNYPWEVYNEDDPWMWEKEEIKLEAVEEGNQDGFPCLWVRKDNNQHIGELKWYEEDVNRIMDEARQEIAAYV